MAKRNQTGIMILNQHFKGFLRPYWLKFLWLKKVFGRLIDILGVPFIRRKFVFVQDQMATNQNINALYEKNFNFAYERGIESAGKDLRIRFRTHQAIWCAMLAVHIDGDFVELGTGKGFTFSAILKYLEFFNSESKKRIFLFDTFLPVKPDQKSGKQILSEKYQVATAYADGIEAVQRNFAEWPNVSLIEGVLPDSASEYICEASKIAFLHVDLNHYLAEIACLKLFFPLLSDGAVILLDDYANVGRERQWQAFSEFFNEKGLHILTTASGQGIVINNRVKASSTE